MSLLAFMQYMTDHPDEMAAYKRDPQAFFEQHPDIALTGDDQSALQKFAFRPSRKEATTVFRVAITPGQGPDANTNAALAAADKSADKHISLKGRLVQVYAHSEAHVFFAEPQQKTDLPCVTLPHSYVYVDDHNNVYLDLHLCYTDPGDPTDRAQVLYITTGTEMPPDAKQYTYMPVTLTIPTPPGYILAVAKGSQFFNKPIKLKEASHYYSGTGELYLELDTADIENE